MGPESIWIASSDGLCVNPPTRHEAFWWLFEHLHLWVTKGAKVFVGWDFSFGLPKGGTALVMAKRRACWADWWDFLSQVVKDDVENRNNRFWVAKLLNRQAGGKGPFWGRAGGSVLRGVPRRKPQFPFQGVREYRECDERLRRIYRWVSSPFQLAGAGAVGGQMLVGIPYVHRLRREPSLEGVSFVYPFELDEITVALNRRGGISVHSEIFLPTSHYSLALFPKDKGQVLAFVAKATRTWKTKEFYENFYQVLRLPGQTKEKVLKEEGWAIVG